MPPTIHDPKTIKKEDLPLIVFSDQTSGLLAFLIKMRTRGDFNHVMYCINPGKFVSQGNTYSEIGMERYTKKGMRLKFVSIKGVSPEGISALITSIKRKLKLPLHKKMYDWLGILGQATGIKWIQTPGLEYCSEDVPQHLKIASEKCPQGFPQSLRGIIKNIPQRTSPQQLNAYLKDFPKYFPVYGKWEADN